MKILFPYWVKTSDCHLQTQSQLSLTVHGAVRYTWQELASVLTVGARDYRGHIHRAYFGDELDKPCSPACPNNPSF